MSFLANKRKTTRLDYFQKYMDIFNHFSDELSRVPKRRQKVIVEPITKCLTDAYTYITTLANYYNVKDGSAPEDKYNLTLSAINSILQLQSPLYTYWNIPKDDKTRKYYDVNGRLRVGGYKVIRERTRFNTIEMLNKELQLLYGVLNKLAIRCGKDMSEIKLLKAYSNDEVNKAQFLKAIKRLHRYCHSKIPKLNRLYRETDGNMIIKNINNAWYYANEGNIFVTNKSQYYTRKRLLSSAISSLKNINVPLFSIISNNNLSEKEAEKWTNMLTDAIKLLQAVQKSDNERYGNYK